MFALSAKEPFEILRRKIEEIFFVTVLRSIIILVYDKRKLHYSGNGHLDFYTPTTKKWRLDYNISHRLRMFIYFFIIYFLLFFLENIELNLHLHIIF